MLGVYSRVSRVQHPCAIAQSKSFLLSCIIVLVSVGGTLTAERGTLWVRLPSLHDLRKIPTCFASLSQRARHARAIVFLVHAGKGVSQGAGHERATGQSRVATRAGETTRQAVRRKV